MSEDFKNQKSQFPVLLRKLWRRVRHYVPYCGDSENVFTEIYRENQWGGESGEICSGGGSVDSSIGDAYLEMLAAQSELHGFDEMTFVDLGCGDMVIGNRVIPLGKKYVGVDVVKYVIEHHRQTIKNEKARFEHIDIVKGGLPDGDVCLIRQVFQHLSNRQIGEILPKLGKYRWVYITEHVPSGGDFKIVNLDKVVGKGIRLDKGSGIMLAAEPFNLPPEQLRTVLEVRGNDVGGGYDAGVIRTVLYTPGDGMPRGVKIDNFRPPDRNDK